VEERRRLAEFLNCLDGEIAYCLERADRRGLAARINEAAGFPLIDGLTMRGLTYVLGEQAPLWLYFQGLVESSNQNVRGARPINDSDS